MKVLYILIIACLLITTSSCTERQQSSADSLGESVNQDQIILSAVQIKNAGIQYGKIEKQILSQDINAQGQLVVPFNSQADVVTFCPGVISKVNVKIGTHIEKGQIMAYVITPEYINKQKEYLSAKSNLVLWSQDFQRQEKLNKENVSSEKQYQQTQANYLKAKTTFEALKIELSILGANIENLDAGEISDKMMLISPISGIVDEVFVNVGKYIEPGNTLFTVLDRSKMLVELMIFEKDITKVKAGQRVDFKLGNMGNENYETYITAISGKVRPQAKVVKAIAEFDNSNNDLLPGMFVSAKIHTREDVLDALPDGAIVFDGDKTYFIYYTLDELISDENVSFLKAKVQRGFVEDGYAQVKVLETIPDEAKIVVQGSYYLRSSELQGEE